MDYNTISTCPPISAIINVTDECNLRCKYCFTHPHPQHMKLETGKAAVQWLVDNYEKRPDEMKDHISINFFGGEPMLRYEEFMVPLMEWADENVHLSGGHQIMWGMTTNATLLNTERIRYLAMRKDFRILLSCDGDAETQNMQRRTVDDKDSFAAVEKNFDALLRYFPDITFRSTVTPESVHLLFENYMYARSRGFVNYFFMPNCREPWSMEAIQELGYQMSNIAWVMYQDIINQERPPLKWNDILAYMSKYIINEKTVTIGCDHCGFGCSSVGITTNGHITGCQERNTYDENDLFVIGDLDNGINKDKHMELLATIDGKEHRFNVNLDCENCELRPFCSGRICPSTNYDMTGHPYVSNDITCYWHILTYKIAKAICETAALEDNQEFKEFLTSLGTAYEIL